MGKKLDIKTPFVSANNANLLTSIIGSDSKPVDLTGSDLLEWIPEKMQEDLYNFNEDYIIALETNNDLTQLKVRFHQKNWIIPQIHDSHQILKGLFNGETYHGIGSAMEYVDRITLKKIFNDNSTIHSSNHPLPATLSQSLKKNTSFTIQGKFSNIPCIWLLRKWR